MQTESSIRDPNGSLVIQSFASVTTSHNTCTYFDLEVYTVHNCLIHTRFRRILVTGFHYQLCLCTKQYSWNPLLGKWELFTWPLVQCCSRWGTALISSLLPFLWIPLCVWNIFQTHNPITPFQKYQPESLQLFNVTTSAFRQPVFVYRSEKCMYSRLWLVRWIWVHVSLPLYCCFHICKQILYNGYKVFCTRNKWIHHECAVSFAYSFKN